MCFSATASFGVGAVLLTTGVATMRTVKESNQIPLASIPLIFAGHQITEGMLWIALSGSGLAGWENILTYVYIIIAQILWPITLPIAMLLIEKVVARRKVLFALACLGILAGIYRTYTLSIFGVDAVILEHHIFYEIDKVNSYTPIGLAVYFLTTALPLLISSVRRAWIIGILIIGSYIMTFLIYKEFTPSVWCFFGAIISLLLIFIINDLKKAHGGK